MIKKKTDSHQDLLALDYRVQKVDVSEIGSEVITFSRTLIGGYLDHLEISRNGFKAFRKDMRLVDAPIQALFVSNQALDSVNDFIKDFERNLEVIRHDVEYMHGVALLVGGSRKW